MSKFILLSILSAFLLLPLTAGAIEFTSPIKATTLNNILDIMIKISLVVILPLSIIAVLFAAYAILSSQGETQKLQKGKQILFYGLIGLAVVIVGSGSGALLKNVFKTELADTEIPGVTYKMPSEYGFPNWPLSAVAFWADSLKKSIENLKQELAEAQQKGDEEKIKLLTEEIASQEEAQRSLALWEKKLFEIETTTPATGSEEWENFLDSDKGKAFLKQYGVKGEGDWYQMADGSKYNIKTKEFINSSGQSFTDTRLLGNGTVIYCSK